MLEGIFYIKSYDNYDNFSSNDDYYLDSDSYIKALEKGSFCNENFKLFNEKSVYDNDYNDSNSYEECSCVLLNEDMDSFINHNVNGDNFCLHITLKLDECSDDFEYELKSMTHYHEKMFKLASKKDDYDVNVDYLPKIDIKFSFKNLSGNLSYALLSDCTVLEYNNGNLLLRVDKLTFIKGL